MKPIMSFWSEPYIQGLCNKWINPDTWNLFWLLSVESFTKEYGKPHLYTDEIGKHFLVDQLNLDFQSVYTCLNDLKGKNPNFFSLGKIFAMGIQKEPFIHLDYDAYLFERIPQEIFDTGVFFERPFSVDLNSNILAHTCRPDLFKRVQGLPAWWIDNAKNKYRGFKSGIVGGTNCGFFNRLSQCIFDIINSNTVETWEDIETNARNGYSNISSKLSVSNYTLNEYTPYALAKEMNLTPRFFINNNGIQVAKYSHAHFEKSFSSELYGRIINRLLNSYAHTSEKIHKLYPDNKFEIPKTSLIVMPNANSSIYDSVLRAIIPRKISPNETFVSEYNLSEVDKRLLLKIDGVRIVPAGNNYINSLLNAFRRSSGQLIIILDGHVKCPKLYLEKSIAAYIEHPKSVFCTAANEYLNKDNIFTYGALQDDLGIRPDLREQKESLLDMPEIQCMYGGMYILPNKAMHLISEFSDSLKNIEQCSSLLEKKGFKTRCIKSIICSHNFKKSLEDIIN
jgi:hypothetical protein